MKILKSLFFASEPLLFILCFHFMAAYAEDSAQNVPAEWEHRGTTRGGSRISPDEAQKSPEAAYQESRKKLGQKTHVEIAYRIILSPDMKKVLKKHNPNFEIWKAEDYIPTLIQWYNFTSFEQGRPFFTYQTPSAVIGDFNGDDAVDAVMMGHDKANNLTIAIMSGNNDYNIIELGKGPLKNPKEDWLGVYDGDDGVEYGFYTSLSLVQPGKIKTYNGSEINLTTDAFEIEVFEKASTLFIYKDGKFVSYTLSD